MKLQMQTPDSCAAGGSSAASRGVALGNEVGQTGTEPSVKPWTEGFIFSEYCIPLVLFLRNSVYFKTGKKIFCVYVIQNLVLGSGYFKQLFLSTQTSGGTFEMSADA